MNDSRKLEFRPVQAADREPLLAIAARTWEGHDYLPTVFDAWVADPRGYFCGAFLNGRLIGCGRALRLDSRRAWLEGLRVDYDFHGHGFGREISRHVIERALDMGFEELLFATYFRNQGSVKVSESFGFRRLAMFTSMDLDVLPAAFGVDAIVEEPGWPDVEGFLANDWFFAPPGIDDPEPFFPRIASLRHNATRLVISDNMKYPEYMEISGVQAPDTIVSTACIQAACNAARQRGKRSLHLMLPERFSLAPFTQMGFAYEEREQNVWVYRAHASDLRL